MWNKDNPNWWYRSYAMSGESCWAAVYPNKGTWSLWKGNVCLDNGYADNADDLIAQAECSAVEHGFAKVDDV